MPRVCTSSTRLASLGGDSEPADGSCEGATTCQVSGPTRPVSPYAATRTGTPAGAASPCTWSARRTRVGQRGHLDRPDRPPAQHARQPVDVVGVEVREHHQPRPAPRRAAAGSDPSRPGPGRCPRPPRSRTGVQHETVALADVAGHHHPPARRPAGTRQRHEQHAHHHRPESERAVRRASTAPMNRLTTTQRTLSTAMPSGPDDHPTAATGQIGTAHRDGDDPRGAPRGRRGDPPTEDVRDQPDHSPGETEHRGRPDGRRDQQVRHDRDQRDLAGDRRDQRRAGELGRQRHRDRLGDPARQPAHQPVAPPGCEPDDPRRGQRRERETWRDAPARGRPAAGAGPRHRGPEDLDAVRGGPCRSAPPSPSPRPGARWVRAGRAARTRRLPARPRRPGPRARTPAQRARSSSDPTTRVRLVPETASRWVSPEVRNASVSSSGIRASSPSTRAGTSARGPSGWCDDRCPDRLTQVIRPRGAGPGPPEHLRRSAGAQHAGEVAGPGLLEAAAQP